MKLELKISLEYKSLKDFSIGAEFTKDELLRYSKEIRTPQNWSFQEVTDTAIHNWREDYSHLSWYLKTRLTRIKYIVQSVKIHKNFMYVVMMASSPIFLGLSIANALPVTNVTEVKKVEKITEVSEKPHKKLKKAVKKEAAKMKEVKKEHKELLKELGISELPKKVVKSVSSTQITGITDVQIAQIKSVSGTIQSSELTRVKMFSSREDAIIGYYKEYLKSPELNNSVNAITSIAQFIYEPGLKEDGSVSKLASIGNNGGIKKAVWKGGKLHYTRKLKGESSGMVMSKDDETNLSAFKTFSTIPNFMKGHADFLSTERYKNYRKYAGINTEWAAKQAARELAPDKAGYFTKEDGHKSLQSLISKVVIPTLKKHNLI